MPIEKLLTSCLQHAGVTRADGRPLYRYAVPDIELSTLADALRQRLHNQMPLDRSECAAFCLVVAKLGVPQLNADALRWAPILRASLGDGAAELIGDTFLRQYADNGLGWWGRPLIRVATSTRYLSTLWCEGGGPVNLIQRDYSVMRTFFSEVLRIHTEYPHRDLAAVIEEEQYRLRETLQNEPVRLLTRDVVCEAKRIRNTLHAHNINDDQIEWLDTNDRDWRSRWPFSLNDDNEIIVNFLAGLIQEKPAFREGTSVVVNTVLDPLSNTSFRLRRFLSTPNTLSVQQLSAVASLSEENVADLPNQQWWKLVSSGEQRDAATITRNIGRQDFQVRRETDLGICGDNARRELTLVSQRGTKQLFASTVITGSDAMPEDLWVFDEPSDGQLPRFVGGGSHRTRCDSILFAMPADQRPDCRHGVGPTHVGTIADCVPSWAVYRLKGDVQLFLENDACVVHLQTNVDKATNRWFVLHGTTTTLGFGGSTVWCGLPQVHEVDDTGAVQQVIPRAHLEWRVAGGAFWNTVTDEAACLGGIQIRYVKDGFVLYRQNLLVLPPEFKIRWHGSDEARAAYVVFSGLHTAPSSVMAASTDTLNLSTEAAAAIARFKVTGIAMTTPSPTFKCRLAWTGNRTAELVVASPVPDICVVDAANRRCHLPGPLPVSLLGDGLFLRACFPAPCVPVLVDQDGQVWASLQSESEGSTTYVLPLSGISDRARCHLAAEPTNDGYVRLFVRQRQSAQNEVELRIARSAGQLELDNEGEPTQLIRVPEHVKQQPWFSGPHTSPRLEFVRLAHFDDPLAEAILAPSFGYSWTINRNAIPIEGVLATVWGHTGVCLTPKFIPSMAENTEAAPSADSPKTFDSTVRIRNESERFHAWIALLKTMSRDPGHEAWDELRPVLQNATRLPATTFSVIEALATLPKAAAMCVLRNHDLPRIWRMLERLSFLWSLVPMTDWMRAVTRWRLYTAGTPHDPALSRVVIGNVLAMMKTNGPPCMQPVVNFIAKRQPDLTPEDCTRFGVDPQSLLAYRLPVNMRTDFARDGVAQLLAQLIDDSGDQRWPTGEPASFVNEHVSMMLDALSINHNALGAGQGYRRAVIYAPLFAASRVVHEYRVTQDMVRELIHYRAFNPDWFDEMQSLGVYFLLNERLSLDEHWLADDVVLEAPEHDPTE